MLIPRSAEYALRIAAIIALHARTEGNAQRVLRAKDLATQANVPMPYLQKVLRRMVAPKLLKSARGHGGGFTLSRPPDKISFLDVLESLNLRNQVAPCIFGLKACDPTQPCVLHDHYARLKEYFVAWSTSTTLGSIHSPESPTAARPKSAKQISRSRNRSRS
jgi:Rrf2 family protein